MTLTAAAAAALLVVAGHRATILGGFALAAAVVVGPAPIVAVAGGAAGTIAWRRARHIAREHRRRSDEELVAVDLVALGVAGGLTFDQAARFVASFIGGPVGIEMARLLRHARVGPPPTSWMPSVDSLFRAARRSTARGSALTPDLAAMATSLRRESATRARQRIGRLPVKLLFPMAFLVLPGFVLLVVGPALAGGIARLSL